jgi:hypothetical protein
MAIARTRPPPRAQRQVAGPRPWPIRSGLVTAALMPQETTGTARTRPPPCGRSGNDTASEHGAFDAQRAASFIIPHVHVQLVVTSRCCHCLPIRINVHHLPSRGERKPAAHFWANVHMNQGLQGRGVAGSRGHGSPKIRDPDGVAGRCKTSGLLIVDDMAMFGI